MKNLNLFVGPIGLVSMLAAKAMGADTVIMTGKIFIYFRVMVFSLISII